MDRQIVYTQEQFRSWDYLLQNKEVLLGLCYLSQDVTGSGITVASGLGISSSGTLIATLTAGRIYQLANADTNNYSLIPLDTTQVLQQGIYTGGTLTFSTTGLSSGQSFYALVQAQYQQVDVILANDPTSGVLTYVNPGNPNSPFIGPNNTGAAQNTTRQGQLVLQIVYGTAATTGLQVPPNPSGGWIPLYLTLISFGQTSLGTFYVCGPSVAANVPSNYPFAPFLAGLLNSHHSGNAGQAPQIKLASEVQGTLGLANLPASNTTGVLPTVRVFAGNPNSNVAGNVQDFVWDSTHLVLWECTTTGSSSTAVWVMVSAKTQNNTLDDGNGNVTLKGNAAVLKVQNSAGSLTALKATNGGVVTTVDNTLDDGSGNATFIGTVTLPSISNNGHIALSTDSSGNVIGGGNLPSGVSNASSGVETVVLNNPTILVAVANLNGANHTVNIGSSYPNAKIAILTIPASTSLASGGITGASISFGPSGTPSGLQFFYSATNGAASTQNINAGQMVYVTLSPGSNPSFVYNGNTSGTAPTISIELVGIIQ